MKKRQHQNNNVPNENINSRFTLRRITPLTPNQEKSFKAWNDGYHLMLHGAAGTGKTFISLYLALKEILTEDSVYDKVVIVRSAVQGRDIGFLPGTSRDKAKVFEDPYKEICDDLFGNGGGYDILKTKHLIEFVTTSFLRGKTWNNAIVIVDESQNCNFGEIDTIITRMGNNSRIIFAGDYRQTDLNKINDTSGINKFMQISARINSFTNIEFEINDIVRSGLVKEYLISKAVIESR